MSCSGKYDVLCQREVEQSRNERGVNTRKAVRVSPGRKMVPKETPPLDCVTNLLGYTWHMQSDVFTASPEHVASNCSCWPSTAGAEISGHFPKLFFWQTQFPDPFCEKASQIKEAVCLPLQCQKDSQEGEISKLTCQRQRREHGNYFQSVFLQVQGEASTAPLPWSCTLPDLGQLLKLCWLALWAKNNFKHLVKLFPERERNVLLSPVKL